jgi:hypothetical protein
MWEKIVSKIVKAINVMASHPELISGVIKGAHETECFFVYDKKHKWSILKNSKGDFYLSYYPGDPDLAEISKIPDEYWDEHGPRAVSYNSKDLATKEATDSLRDLYTIVSEKAYGIDDILDDIIASDKEF